MYTKLLLSDNHIFGFVQYKSLPSALHSVALVPNYYSFNFPTKTFACSSGFVHFLKLFLHCVVNTLFRGY